MMKNNKLSRKKRKKDRTWAEAATLALQMSSNKIYGIRQILETIYHKNLKEISLDKAAENVLTTMLNHHVQLPNCPFFRVKGRNGLYALKSNWLKKQGELVPKELYEHEQADTNSIENTLHSNTDEIMSNEQDCNRENHAYSIQGKSLQSGSNKKYMFQRSLYRKKNSLLRPSSIHNRRHSSPMKIPFRSQSPLTQRRPPIVTRAASMTSRYALPNHHHTNHAVKNNSNLDLESPSSVLVNANMRALVNKETFSLLPASYRFKLTQMLPQCDQSLISVGVEDHKILAPSSSALTNEFFTQAVQEWRDRLTDGEFTRETQSRIVQEIAKERSKVEPWKEKFFEEYYGQKKVPHQRLRVRSQNLAAEAGHRMRDLGMDAQLALFAHLRPELEENSSEESSDSEPLISEEDDDLPLQNLVSTPNPLVSKGDVIPTKTTTTVEKTGKQKRENSKPPVTKSPLTTVTPPEEEKSTGATTSLVMRPTWSLAGLGRTSNAQMPSSTVSTGHVLDPGTAILHVQKRGETGEVPDHSYTSTLWKNIGPNNKVPASSIRTLTTTTFSPRTSSTLVLFPNGHLVQSTIAHLQRPDHVTKRRKNEESQIKSIVPGNDVKFKSSAVKPSVHVISTIAGPSDTERVLSLRARPLTPESFVGGGAKSVGVISNVARQSPLVDTSDRPSSSDHKPTTACALPLRHSTNHNQPSNDVITREKKVSSNPTKIECLSNDVSAVTCTSPPLIVTSPSQVASSTGSVTHSSVTAQPPLPHTVPLIVPHPFATLSTTTAPANLPSTTQINLNFTHIPAHLPTSPAKLPPIVPHAHQVLSSPHNPRLLLSQLPPAPPASNFRLPAPQMQVPPMLRLTAPFNHPPPTSNNLCSTSASNNLSLNAHLHPCTAPIISPALVAHVSPQTSPTKFRLPASFNAPVTLATSLSAPRPPPSQPAISPPTAPLLSGTLPQSTLPQSSIPPPCHKPTPQSGDLSATTSTPILPPSSSFTDEPGKVVKTEKCQVVSEPPPSMTTPSQPPLVSTRPLISGVKRSCPDSSSPAQHPPSSSSPSPLKKARTLAEIKAKMKEKRAAAGGRPAPLVSKQPPVVSQQTAIVANANSHVFSATTFPVYFPTVNDPNLKISLNHMGNSLSPPSASYIRLPSTGTLPLERVQWVSHQGDVRPGIQSGSTPPKLVDNTPPMEELPTVSVQDSPVTSSSPSATCSSSKPKGGKITLKIKTGGSAISLKVDADVIQKEMARSVQAPSSDEDDDSSDGSVSDDSDPPKLFKHHRGPIKLPKLSQDMSDSDSDLDRKKNRRWSAGEELDMGQGGRKMSSSVSRAPPTSRTTSVPTPLLPTVTPVFGVPPFSVSVTPGSTIMTSSNNNYIKGSLFQSNSLFANISAPNAWSSRKMSPSKSAEESKAATTSFHNKSNRSFRSNSKGKDMENMQKLARIFNSDDSADSSDDDDRADSTFSTTTSDKCSDSDDDVGTPLRHQSKMTSPECQRQTRSSLGDENKPNSLDELTSSNPTMKST